MNFKTVVVRSVSTAQGLFQSSFQVPKLRNRGIEWITAVYADAAALRDGQPGVVCFNNC